MGEIIHEKKTIPNAVKKIEHIMKHSIPPPNDKALIIFSWLVLIQIQSYPYQSRPLLNKTFSDWSEIKELFSVWHGFSTLYQAGVLIVLRSLPKLD